MTKYPLVFISAPRSLFYHEKLGGQLQDFIEAHGYVVHSPAMPFRSQSLRQRYLQSWLQRQTDAAFHFILAEDTYQELKDVLPLNSNSTFTRLPVAHLNNSAAKPLTEPLFYKYHRLFSLLLGVKAPPYQQVLLDRRLEFYDRFLDHCVELAENEVI
ncbi:hypothetical protein [Pseudobdellovibrio exovorus]|nr:hypothetical protein [Pseudobdellovibrio exovorus]